MSKKIICILLICSFIPILSGCWSYKALNELAIVAGIAIDKDEGTGNYKVTFETIDVSGSLKESGAKPQIIESEGVTLFDAFRNTKKRVATKLFYGDTQLVILSNQLARQEGVAFIIDFFIRDSEPRETLNVIISRGNTAKSLLTNTGISSKLVSFEGNKIIESDEKTISSSLDIKLYELYNRLKSPGAGVVLPVFNQTMNNGKPANSSDGLALFKDAHLIGYLSSEETKYYLFAIDKIKGGLLPFDATGDGTENATLEISRNKTKIDLKYENNKVKAIIEPSTFVFLGELNCYTPDLDYNELKKIEEKAIKKLTVNIKNVIEKAQKEYKTDIFGFGNMFYKKNPKMWNQISGEWESLFEDMEVEVKPQIKIVNSVYSKKT